MEKESKPYYKKYIQLSFLCNKTINLARKFSISRIFFQSATGATIFTGCQNSYLAPISGPVGHPDGFGLPAGTHNVQC